MQKPLTITFRHMDPSPALEQTIRKRASKLEHFYDRIIHCVVTIDSAHRPVRHGFPFEVTIEVVVPGKNIVAKTSSEMNHAHLDAHTAIRRTFDVAERRLEDYARMKRQKVKHRAPNRIPTDDNNVNPDDGGY